MVATNYTNCPKHFFILSSQVVPFSKIQDLHNLPELKLGGEKLNYSNTGKFLGLTFDSKLTWNPHLAKLKNQSQKLLGIMKMITSQKCGATQECLMKIFRTYIRSKIDWGSIIYASAPKTTLSRIDVVAI